MYLFSTFNQGLIAIVIQFVGVYSQIILSIMVYYGHSDNPLTFRYDMVMHFSAIRALDLTFLHSTGISTFNS